MGNYRQSPVIFNRHVEETCNSYYKSHQKINNQNYVYYKHKQIELSIVAITYVNNKFYPFRKYFHIAPGIESVESRTCSVGNSVIIFLHFKKIAFKVFIGHESHSFFSFFLQQISQNF
jgi:hypothetical protein